MSEDFRLPEWPPEEQRRMESICRRRSSEELALVARMGEYATRELRRRAVEREVIDDAARQVLDAKIARVTEESSACWGDSAALFREAANDVDDSDDSDDSAA